MARSPAQSDGLLLDAADSVWQGNSSLDRVEGAQVRPLSGCPAQYVAIVMKHLTFPRKGAFMARTNRKREQRKSHRPRRRVVSASAALSLALGAAVMTAPGTAQATATTHPKAVVGPSGPEAPRWDTASGSATAPGLAEVPLSRRLASGRE